MELKGKLRPSFGGKGHSLGAGSDSGAADPRLARLARFGGSTSTTASEKDANEVANASSKLTNSTTSSINEKLLAADSGVEIKPMASRSV